MIEEWLSNFYIMLGMNLGIITAIAVILLQRQKERDEEIKMLENEYCR